MGALIVAGGVAAATAQLATFWRDPAARTGRVLPFATAVDDDDGVRIATASPKGESS